MGFKVNGSGDFFHPRNVETTRINFERGVGGNPHLTHLDIQPHPISSPSTNTHNVLSKAVADVNSWFGKLDIKPAATSPFPAENRYDRKAPGLGELSAKLSGTLTGALPDVKGWFASTPKTDPFHNNWSSAITAGTGKKPQGIQEHLTSITDAARAHITAYGQIGGNLALIATGELLHVGTSAFEATKTFALDGLPQLAKLALSPLQVAWDAGTKFLTPKAPSAEAVKTTAEVSHTSLLQGAVEAFQNRFKSASTWFTDLFKPLKVGGTGTLLKTETPIPKEKIVGDSISAGDVA